MAPVLPVADEGGNAAGPGADVRVQVVADDDKAKNLGNVAVGHGHDNDGNHPPTRVESAFMAIGRSTSTHPWKYLIGSVLVCVMLCYGWAIMETENRPEKQWVPTGSPALEQKDYVDQTWGSRTRFNFWIAKCKPAGCNILEPQYLRRLLAKDAAIKAIVVDGTALRESSFGSISAADWDSFGYNGNWSFEGNLSSSSKCFKFGPFCAERSVLDVFHHDEHVVNENLTATDSLRAINFWEQQKTMCPLSMARSDSPCIDTSAWMPSASANDCNNYATTTERTNCRNASQAYCDAVCPTTCAGPSCTATGACADGGCLSLGRFSAMAASTTNWTGAAAGGAAADPFKIRTVASSGMNGPVLAGDGSVASAVAVFGYYALNDDRSMIDGSEEDPVASEWEKHALCALGIKYDSRDDAFVCPEDDLLDFKVNFQRSFEDEFGAAIRGDVAGLGISYMAILIYFIVMLSRRDHVHSMIGMGIVTLLTVGLSFGAGMGLGALFGIPNNQLTNNIPFLLLGLGVDDAFVLSSEFQRIKRQRPSNSVVDNIVTTARHGGVSILITSATDALAFLVGSATVLPALAGFCQFAGIGVIICFILQLTFFLPALALNARRANDNRYDVICCSKASEKHHFEEERGCCFCCRCKSGQLPRAMRRFGEAITSRIGAAAVIVLFLAIMGVGLAGSLQIYKDFRLEWFFPDDSYVNVYFKWNREYFSAGTPVSIYTRDINYFQAQPSMQRLSGYLNTSDFVDPSEQVNDWHDAFLRDASSTAFVNAQGVYTSESDYYTQLHGWWASGAGVRYQSQLKWVDTTCDNATATTCDASRGIKASKLGATLKLEYTDKGQIRYDTMDTMRSEIATIMADYGGSRNFPFSYQFLYWEEVGIIDVELARNIIICAVVIATMVFMMVPHPRISVWVILSILLSINSLCGFMHWWGVTISGVSTIYILISVGLAVDYSAHIAHMFVESTGTSRERAIAALERIGPSVFNAVVSTMLAVIVVGFSKSYVFRVFFKALFLTVLLGGAHGLVFLPTVLSLLGGSKAAPPAAAKKKGVELVGTKVSM